MRFFYEAKDIGGGIQKGTIEASSKESAIELLKRKGLFVISLEKEFVPIYARRIKFLERVKTKEIVYFSREMAIMLKANVPLAEIFRTIYNQTKNNLLKEVVFNISKEVEGGSTLSEALAAYPNIFSDFYIAMVKAGEASGKLTQIFLYLADYLEKNQRFKGKIISALIYPAFIVIVFMSVIALMITMVVPTFSDFLEQTNQEPPLITKIVMGLSEFLRKWGLFILPLVIITPIILYILIRRNKTVKFFKDRIFLKTPFLNVFLKKIYLNRFALNVSTLISGGVSIGEALDITAQVVGNDVYKKVILKTRDGIKKGEKMSSVLKKYPHLISPFFHQMIIVGEKTGTLDNTLLNVVRFYEEEVDRALESFTKMIEPLLIIVLGGLVGFLIAAILIPLYSSMSSMGG